VRRRRGGAGLVALLLSGALGACGGNAAASSTGLAGRIEGIVRACVNGAPTPVARAQVQVVGTGITALTSGTGRFVITDLPVGVQLQLRASLLGYAPTGTAVTVTETGTAAVTIDFPGDADRIVLSREAVSLLPGETVTLVATVADCFGHGLNAAGVTWTSGDLTVATVGDDGVVTAAGVGETAITATSEGVSGVTKVTVTGGSGSPGTDDEVLLAGGVSGKAVVLADGRFADGGTPACTNDFLKTGTTSVVPLGGNMMTPGSCAASELVVFSPGHAVFYATDPAEVPWTDMLGDQATATLQSPIDVEVIFWVETGITNSFVGGQYADAQTALADNHTGLQLVPAAAPLIQSVSAGAVGTGCSSVGVAKANGKYDAERLNVYVVHAIDSGEWGLYCYQHGVPNALYLDGDVSGPNTLLHELGHAFGLIEPWDGHVGGLSGIPGDGSSNIMWKTDTGAGKEITLGQAFRMSLGTLSWVNTLRPSSTAVRGKWATTLGISAPTATCSCAAYAEADACPAVGLTDPAPGTVTAGFAPPCSATLVPPTLPLSCSTPGTLTATFHESGTSGPQLFAPVVWIVDPAILHIEEALEYGIPGSSSPPPKFTLTVTGKANGTTDVVVYGGGPSSKAVATVQVTGC